MKKYISILMIALGFVQASQTQGYLVNRTADQVGISYARQSSSNMLGAMYGHSFDGKIDAGVGVSRIFTSPSFSNFNVGAYGDYYFLKQSDDFPLTLAGGVAINYNKVSSASVTGVTPNATAYYKVDLEDFLVQPFANFAYTQAFSSGNSSGSSRFSLGANFAFPGDNEAFFVFTPSFSFGDGSNLFGVALTYILPAKSGSSTALSQQRDDRPDITVPVEMDHANPNTEVNESEEQRGNVSQGSEGDTPENDQESTSDQAKDNDPQMRIGQKDQTPDTTPDQTTKTVKTETETTSTQRTESESGVTSENPGGQSKDGLLKIEENRNTINQPPSEGSESNARSDDVNAYLDDTGTYFVQIAALAQSKGKVSDFRKALFVGSLYRKPTSLNYKIRVGKFRSQEEADVARQKLIELGFVGAFIVEDADQAFYELMDYE